MQQVEEGQGVSYFCVTVLRIPDRNNLGGKFHFGSQFWRDFDPP